MTVSLLRLSLSFLADWTISEILCNIIVLEISYCLLELAADMNFEFRMNWLHYSLLCCCHASTVMCSLLVNVLPAALSCQQNCKIILAFFCCSRVNIFSMTAVFLVLWKRHSPPPHLLQFSLNPNLSLQMKPNKGLLRSGCPVLILQWIYVMTGRNDWGKRLE